MQRKMCFDLGIRIKFLRFRFFEAVALLFKDFEEYVCFSDPK